MEGISKYIIESTSNKSFGELKSGFNKLGYKYLGFLHFFDAPEYKEGYKIVLDKPDFAIYEPNTYNNRRVNNWHKDLAKELGYDEKVYKFKSKNLDYECFWCAELKYYYYVKLTSSNSKYIDIYYNDRTTLKSQKKIINKQKRDIEKARKEWEKIERQYNRRDPKWVRRCNKLEKEYKEDKSQFIVDNTCMLSATKEFFKYIENGLYKDDIVNCIKNNIIFKKLTLYNNDQYYPIYSSAYIFEIDGKKYYTEYKSNAKKHYAGD